MTNNTIPNVPRELLERASNLAFQTQHYPLHEELRTLLSAPSPAGVGGLEVMSNWVLFDAEADKPYIKKILPEGFLAFFDCEEDARRAKANNPRTDYKRIDRVKAEDAQSIIDGLRGEVERLQMQLAACGVVALANTIESAGEARQMHPDYMSASCSDVAGAVDREIALRAERNDLLQQLAVRDEEIERTRVQLMTIASAEPARHSIEWAKAMASTGNNEVYAKWREAFDQRDQQARRIGELEAALEFACKALAQVTSSDGSGHADIAVSVLRMAGTKDADALHVVEDYKAGAKWRIDAALAVVCAAAPNIATTSEHSSQPERDPCPMCIKGGICNTPTCGRLLAMPKAY